LGTNEPVGNV